jgi:ribonuclease BN (tRNA processing enzyme)
MILTVLGCSGTYPRPGGACNGFLIQEGDINLVLDLGNGCMSNLIKKVEFTKLSALIISHMHVDHFGDLYPLFYALRFYPDEPWGLHTYLPEGGLGEMSCILGEDSQEYVPRVFREMPIVKGNDYQIGDMSIAFYPTRHPVEGYAVRLQGKDWLMAYSSDTTPCQGVVEAAAGADLFVCEATFPASYAREASFGHLTSRQAGEMAAKAGVKSLLLTHIWPTFDKEAILEEAKEVYGGEAAAAYEGMEVRLGGAS